MGNYWWRFTRGTWEALPGSPCGEEKEGENWTDHLKKGGYERLHSAPAEGLLSRDGDDYSVEILGSENGTFVVTVDVPFDRGIAAILVDDAPSLLMLFPVLSAWISMTAFYDSDLHGIARKAFRAFHGHDAFRPCRQCDPDEMERQANWKAKAKTAKPPEGT